MNQYIHIQDKRIGALRQRLFSAIALLLVSSLMLSSASFAWLTISQAPEAAGVTSNIGANGNLEIALGKNIGESAVGDSSKKTEVTQANRTWGNIIDLSDESYGLQEITLRPAILNAAGGAVNTLHPLSYPVYGADGRVARIYSNNVFAGTYNGTFFTTSVNDYGVRGIGAAAYIAPGEDDTFGPLSQRQETYYRALNNLWQMMKSSYADLCRDSQNVLMAYCYYGADVSAADFNLDTFSKKVDAVVAATNEELRLNFTILAAAEMTASEDYFMAVELLGEEYPDYESVQPLVETAIRATGAADVGAAIAELRVFQDVAAQLKTVITSGEIDGSDGYSMEEIAQTVGLIFDLEKTNFSISTISYQGKTCSQIQNYFYSNVISELYYQIPYHEVRGWGYVEDGYIGSSYGGSSVCNLTSNLNHREEYQDNDSREGTANSIIDSHMYLITKSLPLADLKQAIAGLYVSHWDYWDNCAEEYQQLLNEVAEIEPPIKLLENSILEQQEELDVITKEIEDLEQQLAEAIVPSIKAELQTRLSEKQAQASSIQKSLNMLEADYLPKAAELAEKEAQLQTLVDEKIYTSNDSRLETIRVVMEDTIEAMRKYVLWSIAYNACDGQIPDDAYHRILEMVNSSENIHPRTVYQALCNYGVTPANALTQMVATYEKLEQELLFLPGASKNTDAIMWSELSTELQRIFGTITHNFHFYVVERDSDDNYSYVYSSYYSPEDISAPTDVMTKIQEEIKAYETAEYDAATFWYKGATLGTSYGSYEENRLWAQALGLLVSFYDSYYHSSPFAYGDAEYSMETLQFPVEHSMPYTGGFPFAISIGVGSEDNFKESGLTVRQTRFQKAQENISYYQNQLITAAVNVDKNMVTLLMQMIAGQSSVSLVTISDYLTGLQQQLEYGEAMMYHAALAIAASNYADDTVYNTVYSGSAPKDAASLIALLLQSNFDEKVLTAFSHRMELLNNQEALLGRSVTLLKNYQDPKTGALTAEQIPTAEAVALLNPVLDTASLTLYGYVEEEWEQDGKTGATLSPSYLRTVLYDGYGSPTVQISGKQATIGTGEPITLFGDVYLSLGRSLSGSILALAKTQVETYIPPAGSLNADDIANSENGINRQSYVIGTDENMFTLNLCTVDTPYALPTNLWTYTGNTDYISANNILLDLYGYCIDLSLRTNTADSDLLLQTEAANRIYNDGEAQTDATMGAGSYMEFTAKHSSYSLDMAQEYMSCLRVAITDTNTGYIYGYAALDMDAAELIGLTIKAPLRLYDKDTGIMLEGDAAQYICHMDQNLEKNLTVYVYLDGAKTSDAIVSAYDELSMHGVLNLQFSSSADLKPAVMEDLR